MQKAFGWQVSACLLALKFYLLVFFSIRNIWPGAVETLNTLSHHPLFDYMCRVHMLQIRSTNQSRPDRTVPSDRWVPLSDGATDLQPLISWLTVCSTFVFLWQLNILWPVSQLGMGAAPHTVTDNSTLWLPTSPVGTFGGAASSGVEGESSGHVTVWAVNRSWCYSVQVCGSQKPQSPLWRCQIIINII